MYLPIIDTYVLPACKGMRYKMIQSHSYVTPCRMFPNNIIGYIFMLKIVKTYVLNSFLKEYILVFSLCNPYMKIKIFSEIIRKCKINIIYFFIVTLSFLLLLNILSK